MNYKTMSIDEQREAHSGMISTANDLGMTVPQALSIDFQTTDQGASICRALDSAILKFRASHPEPESGSGEAGQKDTSEKGVAKGDTEVQSARVPAPQEEPKKDRAKLMADQKAARLAREASSPAVQPKPDKGTAKEKKTVAKKATAKKAAAKSSGKKAAKAASAPKAPRAGALDEAAKITWIGVKGENPYRGEKKDRYELLRKGSGKTVKTLIAGGVPSETLRNAVKNKMVKLG